MSAWKSAGLSYLQYANICARALRNSLKNDLRVAAEARNQNNLKFAKWSKGVASEQKPVAEFKPQQQ
ncbi:hypothetical protein K492DRAFT_144061 [Lichtheimia hyalospora FSU 10163]|nr:hypothetical protein K492DRAFT_144061 [Lichtheimia hyalospora FSU 10163]